MLYDKNKASIYLCIGQLQAIPSPNTAQMHSFALSTSGNKTLRQLVFSYLTRISVVHLQNKKVGSCSEDK